MIYLLEDDKSIRELIVYTMESQGYEILGFDRPSLFKLAFEEREPDLAILDIMLPEESGLDVLKYIRETKHSSVMVLMLTAKSTEFDKVLGLDAGADDYLGKPFGMMELIARVKALLRRKGGNEQKQDMLSAGPVVMNIDKHKVFVHEKEVELTYKEFKLLETLLANKGIVMSREQLIEKVWGYDFYGDSRTVDVHIRTLRQKLSLDTDEECIKTIRGIGYKVE